MGRQMSDKKPECTCTFDQFHNLVEENGKCPACYGKAVQELKNAKCEVTRQSKRSHQKELPDQTDQTRRNIRRASQPDMSADERVKLKLKCVGKIPVKLSNKYRPGEKMSAHVTSWNPQTKTYVYSTPNGGGGTCKMDGQGVWVILTTTKQRRLTESRRIMERLLR